jgi:hypothetical protein
MGWPEVRLASWADFQKVRDGVPKRSPGMTNYIFRGQADSGWRLEPSLTRELKKIRADITPEEGQRIEVELLNQFAANVRNHFSQEVADSRTNPAARWSLMQHHHAPTRLLDWTNEISVAAYFAVESHWDRNGAIWMVLAGTLNEAVKRSLHGAVINYEMLGCRRAEPVVQLWMEDHPHERVAAQDGLFTFCHQVFGDQENIIEQVCAPEAERSKLIRTVFCKIIIPRELKPTLLTKLKLENVTAESLFPGSDGFGRSLLDLARMMACNESPTAQAS